MDAYRTFKTSVISEDEPDRVFASGDIIPAKTQARSLLLQPKTVDGLARLPCTPVPDEANQQSLCPTRSHAALQSLLHAELHAVTKQHWVRLLQISTVHVDATAQEHIRG